jgi:hypothetical protein
MPGAAALYVALDRDFTREGDFDECELDSRMARRPAGHSLNKNGIA